MSTEFEVESHPREKSFKSEEAHSNSMISWFKSMRGIAPLFSMFSSLASRSGHEAGASSGAAASTSFSTWFDTEGYLNFTGETKPDQILISIEDPFNSKDMVQTALSMLRRPDVHVHLLWITDSPHWGGFSFNGGLVAENLRYVRQRAIARLEHLTGVLEQQGYSATWEAEESDERDEQIARLARELETDLLVLPAPTGIGFFVQRRLKALTESAHQPILTIGADQELQLVEALTPNTAERPVYQATSQRTVTDGQGRPVRERLSARVLDS